MDKHPVVSSSLDALRAWKRFWDNCDTAQRAAAREAWHKAVGDIASECGTTKDLTTRARSPISHLIVVLPRSRRKPPHPDMWLMEAAPGGKQRWAEPFNKHDTSAFQSVEDDIKRGLHNMVWNDCERISQTPRPATAGHRGTPTSSHMPAPKASFRCIFAFILLLVFMLGLAAGGEGCDVIGRKPTHPPTLITVRRF